MIITPYKNTTQGKKQQVATMFNNIAPNYDFLNHFLSLGIDISWRKRAIGILKGENPRRILDIATGTGDFAIAAMAINPEKITGLDISEGMLAVGQEKINRKKLQNKIELVLGDSENLPFPENTYDAITVGFGVRNFENLDKGLCEIYRVLSINGTVIILEFSRPKKFPVKQLYNFYFNHLLPLIGNLISKDKRAYTYLPQSVNAFPDGEDFLDILNKTGFKRTSIISLLFGIASIYTGKK